MNKIIYKDLSYKLTGFFYKIHNKYGRFLKEKQYADKLEELLRKEKINFKREIKLDKIDQNIPVGNIADFVIEDQVVVDIKAKKFITKEDYFQMQRYLKSANLELGLIVNFRNTYLKPKRVLNSYHSCSYSDHSHRVRGFGIIEIIVAMGILVIIAATATSSLLGGLITNRLGDEETEAYLYTQEGIEAVKSIKNQGWCTPFLSTDCTTTSCGLTKASGYWAYSGTNNILDSKFTRTIKVEPINRDGSGNIVASGGTNDPNTKKVTSTTTWNFSAGRTNTISLTTYLTNFRKSISTGVHGGMLVYGNGGTGSDAMVYRQLNGSTGIWEAAIPMPDFDGATSGRAVRAVRLDASSTRDEKIVLVRRYRTSNREQSIWAYVWNGSSWMSTGSPFAVWTSSSYLDVRNFDGTYLSNENYMFVYSDNTSTPKYKIWDGCSWSEQNSLVNLANNGSGVPLYIVARARQGTNEVMAGFFGVARDTNTQYYNGISWTLHARHSGGGPANKEMIDFAWSPNSPTEGALVYPASATDRNITVKIWTADGGGSGSWSSAANTSNQGTLGAMNIDGRFGGDEFLACSKDASNDIYCFKSTFTPSWQTPTNNILTTNTHTGIQRSYDFTFESSSGTDGLAVYSVNSNTPKKRIYTPGGSPSFSPETDLLTTQLGGTLTTVRTRAFKDNDDIMILMGDSLNDLYTVVWNGSANAVYTMPSGKARTLQGTNGSAITNFWYDFAWDRF